jgi:hypothetical protein
MHMQRRITPFQQSATKLLEEQGATARLPLFCFFKVVSVNSNIQNRSDGIDSDRKMDHNEMGLMGLRLIPMTSRYVLYTHLSSS